MRALLLVTFILALSLAAECPVYTCDDLDTRPNRPQTCADVFQTNGVKRVSLNECGKPLTSDDQDLKCDMEVVTS